MTFTPSNIPWCQSGSPTLKPQPPSEISPLVTQKTDHHPCFLPPTLEDMLPEITKKMSIKVWTKWWTHWSNKKMAGILQMTVWSAFPYIKLNLYCASRATEWLQPRMIHHQIPQCCIDELVRERRNSIANTLELRLSCTKPSVGSQLLTIMTIQSFQCANCWVNSYTVMLLTLFFNFLSSFLLSLGWSATDRRNGCLCVTSV